MSHNNTPLVYFESVINRQDVPLSYFQTPHTENPNDVWKITPSMISGSTIALDRLEMSTEGAVEAIRGMYPILEEERKRRSWWRRLLVFLRLVNQ